MSESAFQVEGVETSALTERELGTTRDVVTVIAISKMAMNILLLIIKVHTYCFSF
jgi:hypothetical protein